MTDFAEGTIETKFGTVKYSATSGDHVCLHIDDGQRITVRGIQYRFNFHLHLIEGEWKCKDHRELYVSRPDDWSKEPSDAARRAIREEMTKAWLETVNDDILRSAERGNLQRQIERAQDEVKELTDKLNEATAKLNRLGAELHALGGFKVHAA